MPYQIISKSKTISINEMSFNTGTWTETDTSNILTKVKTTGDDTSIIRVPLDLERNESGLGVKITELEFLYKVGTAALDADATIALVRNPLSAGPTSLTVTTTDDFAQTATAGLVKCTVTPTYLAFDRVEANNSTSNKTTVPVEYFLEITVPTDADNSYTQGPVTVYYDIEE